LAQIRKKKKKKAAAKAQNVDSAQEKEWARMVFVQQLRQQQQHNDEINRVKTLWKQERQVRVEMHKKVVKEKKNCKKILFNYKLKWNVYKVYKILAQIRIRN